MQLVRGGAVKDVEEGELILSRISHLWPHGSHALLANLKAEQERYTKGPKDVLKTLEPFVSTSEQCCWALNKALWAHWILGDVSKVSLKCKFWLPCHKQVSRHACRGACLQGKSHTIADFEHLVATFRKLWYDCLLRFVT